MIHGLDPLLLCRWQGLGLLLLLILPGLHIHFAHWAVSQAGCEPSDLKGPVLFKAFFLALGHT